MDRGESADAIAALYDAFSTAMQLHLLSLESEAISGVLDDRESFAVLRRAGILDSSMDEFSFLEDTLEDAIAGRTNESDTLRFFAIVERLLIRLGIIPFPESSFPGRESVTT